MKKILIISYYWPPNGGVGAYRVTKFAKYLAKSGWNIIVLTPKHAETQLIDNSLLDGFPDNIKVVRSGIFEPTAIIKRNKNINKGVTNTLFLNRKSTFTDRITKWVRLNLFIPDAKIGWYPYAVAAGKRIINTEKPDLIFSTSPPPTTNLIANKLAKWTTEAILNGCDLLKLG